MLLGELDGRVPSGHSGCGVTTVICGGNTVGAEGIEQHGEQSLVTVECSEKVPVLCQHLVFRCKLRDVSTQ